MPIEPPTTHRPRHTRAEERRPRVGILRLGSLLGWDAPRVAHFAEGVTGRPLRRGGCAELQRVLAAYASQPGATCPHGSTP